MTFGILWLEILWVEKVWWYIYKSVPFNNIIHFESPSECRVKSTLNARDYIIAILFVLLVSSFKRIYSFARLRAASSRQINFHESFGHTIIECDLPLSRAFRSFPRIR